MLENLSKRERTLALVVFGMLPLMAVFFSVTWFTNKYFEGRTNIRTTNELINEQQHRQSEAALAAQRRVYYRSLSLPGGTKKSEVTKSKTAYERWVQDLVKNKLKMDFRSWDPGAVTPVTFSGRNGRTLVYEKHPFSLKVQGTLKQLTNLLYEMRELDLLHRIASIKLQPLNEGKGNSKIRTGLLSLGIDIEVIAMTDAVESRDFLAAKRELAQTLDELNDKIVRRNVFGPANNTPSMVVSENKTVYTGSDVSFTITGKDADANDSLTFELVSSGVEGASFSAPEGSRTAKFTCPELAPGAYPFLVRVTDSGYPAKSFEKSFTLQVKEKPVPVVAAPEPPKPKFKHAGQTAVKSVTTHVDGIQRVGIKVMTTDQRFELQAGQTFELDDKVWTIKSMTTEEVVIEVDGKNLTFQVGDRLDKPAAIL